MAQDSEYLRIMNVALVYNELNITDQIKNIILIHDQVGNYNEFVDGCNAFTFPIVYNYRSTKSELTDVLHLRTLKTPIFQR